MSLHLMFKQFRPFFYPEKTKITLRTKKKLGKSANAGLCFYVFLCQEKRELAGDDIKYSFLC